MRLEKLTLNISGDEVVMRFHDRLTVVSGIGAAERAEMADLLVAALTGTLCHPATLDYVDGCGRSVTLTADSRGGSSSVYADGTPAPDLVKALGLDPAALAKLVRVSAADVGILAADISSPSTGELADARNMLAALERDVRQAQDERAQIEAMRSRLEEIDALIRNSRETEAKRRFAGILVDLERVRAEAAVLRGGAEGADSDRRLIGSADGVHRLASSWREALATVAQAATAFGDRVRLDERTLAEALAAPADLPEGLEEKAELLRQIEERRDALTEQLSAETTAHLPEPSHPAVGKLARAEQAMVWQINQRVLDCSNQLEQASLRLGGLDSDGGIPAIVDELEEAHREVEQSEHALSERRTPTLAAAAGGVVAAAGALAALPVVAPVGLAGAAGAAVWGVVSPKRRLAKARAREEDALTKAGAPTYLSFHMRRIDATIDQDARATLEAIALQHRHALADWHAIAGDISAEEAIELEDEIRSYAEALARLEREESQVEVLHRQLVEEIEPAVARAREAVLDAVRPFGVVDSSLAVAMARELAGLATTARLQDVLQDAELAEEQAREKMAALLSELGFDEGDVAARLGGFEWALEAAQERSRARAAARPPAVVAAELARLEDLARTEKRAEWGTSVTKDDADGPDEAALQLERAQLAASYAAASRSLPQLDKLTDRRNAVERRVAVLEAEAGGSDVSRIEVGDVEPQLLARLAGARRPGVTDETLFLVLDEPFAKIKGESKWAALDMVERLAGQVQMLYLSDDPDVVTWARRRVAAGAVTLMEPVAETV